MATVASQSSPRSARRREELLASIVDLFLDEGFLEFGIGDLATRLRCSRSTLYVVAASKEQIVLAALRHFFRNAAARIEEKVANEPDLGARLSVYLRAVAEELAPAEPAFYRDLAAYVPGREIYAENIRYASDRVGRLVADAVEAGQMRPVAADFVGSAVSAVMASIQSGDVRQRTGMDDAEAYAALADLVLEGLKAEDGDRREHR